VLLAGPWVAAGAGAVGPAVTAAGFPGIGRGVTAAELKAWDIDVRPDFKGLPAGSGSVAQGQVVWESKCAACHGVFGESGEVFNPLVGGTTADDVTTGHVKRLNDRAYPGRTTLMKVSTISTLWDYIRRAMPWTAPKSLSVDEVYAATAYLLNLGGVLPDDFVLSDRTMAQAQARLPNRNGMTTAHDLWPGAEFGGSGKPDVQGSPCMTNCAPERRVASLLPDFARNAHGNLAEQNRLVGAQHGVDTAGPAGAASAPAAAPAVAPDAAVLTLLQANNCTACHATQGRLVGPGFDEVRRRYASRPDAAAYLRAKIRSGGSGTWGGVTMPPQTLSDADAGTITAWLVGGGAK